MNTRPTFQKFKDVHDNPFLLHHLKVLLLINKQNAGIREM